jgi:DNA-binding transcriptional regulator YiaG
MKFKKAPSDTERVLAELQKRGVTRQHIARALGVSWFTAHRWAKGQSTPHPGNMQRLRALLAEGQAMGPATPLGGAV